jgi:hypothetical protein
MWHHSQSIGISIAIGAIIAIGIISTNGATATIGSPLDHQCIAIVTKDHHCRHKHH